jgi:hypothetical protein
MKSKLLYIITFSIFLTLLINAQSEKEIIEASSNEKYWKRHFFDLCLMGGPSFGHYSLIANSLVDVNYYDFGGLIGISFGYQYAFTNKFAFGPGFSGFLYIPGNGFYKENFNTAGNSGGDYSLTYEIKTNYIIGMFSGSTLMFMFMFGDLKNEKIAFLLDVGGGILVSIKLGLYYKGFVFKTGYSFTGIGTFHYADFNYWYYGHHLTFDFGYKINWKRKIRGNPIKKQSIKKDKDNN